MFCAAPIVYFVTLLLSTRIISESQNHHSVDLTTGFSAIYKLSWSLSRMNEATTCYQSTKFTKVYDRDWLLLKTWKIIRIKNSNQLNSCTFKVMVIEKFWLENWSSTHINLQAHYLSLSPNRRTLSPNSRPLSHKVPKLESTRSEQLRTSKISRIDPVVTKLCGFEKGAIFFDRFCRKSVIFAVT